MDKNVKIAAGLVIVVVFVCAIIFVIPQQTAKIPVAGTGSPLHGKVTVYFFYGEECPHCHNIMPFVKSLETKYPDVDFQFLETWHNQKNQTLFTSLNQKLGVKSTGVPEVVVGDVVLIGEVDIPAKLEAAIIGEIEKNR
jgi:thiol-disulfide isomerase/thioredoxin